MDPEGGWRQPIRSLFMIAYPSIFSRMLGIKQPAERAPHSADEPASTADVLKRAANRSSGNGSRDSGGNTGQPDSSDK